MTSGKTTGDRSAHFTGPRFPDDPKRPHHFHFANTVLPSIFYEDPGTVLKLLRSGEGTAYLIGLWEDVGCQVTRNDPALLLPPTGLHTESVDGEGFQGVVVHLPTATQAGEAFLVLMATPTNIREGSIWWMHQSRGAPIGRFFSLSLLPNGPSGELTPLVCERSALLGTVTTGFHCEATASALVQCAVDGLDL